MTAHRPAGSDRPAAVGLAGRPASGRSALDAAGRDGTAAPTHVVLALDGGNSKTDVAVVTLDGRVVARVRGGGASAHLLGVAGAVDALDALVRQALRQAEAAVGPVAVVHTGAYLAGVDLDRERASMTTAVFGRGWSPSVLVDNDTFALLRLGSATGDGVAVVCGAGINCVGVAGDRVVRFPSLGTVSGDWGGGVQLGLAAVSAVARASDGRGPSTALTAAVLDHFGVDSVDRLIEGLHFDEIPQARLAELSPVVFDTATHDPVAVGLVDRLADEIAAFVEATTARLGPAAAGAPVVLGGSILASRPAALLPAIVAVAPDAELVTVTEPPVTGAVLLALDRVGAAPAALARARTDEVCAPV